MEQSVVKGIKNNRTQWGKKLDMEKQKLQESQKRTDTGPPEKAEISSRIKGKEDPGKKSGWKEKKTKKPGSVVARGHHERRHKHEGSRECKAVRLKGGNP